MSDKEGMTFHSRGDLYESTLVTSPIMTSRWISYTTGPGRPLRSAWKARLSNGTTYSGLLGASTHFVMC